MFAFSLGIAVGALYGWYTTKPVWLDVVVQKVMEKVRNLIK